MYKKSYLLIIFLLLFNTFYAGAEEQAEGKSDESKQPLMYFQIDPNILTFYQSTSKKFGYIVVQIQIVVRGQDNYDLVETNLPLVQDTLIDFFNRQSKETIQDLKQRENLRQEAKSKVDEVLKQELGISIVENLLFTQYVFQ
ncbi:flagellar basal body-associated FliL family protein [Aliikangiella sp. IMCC44359]|uniref:flagellar basal body-associated FliL family protein n=1 Tax=Aliikangiella sp. IMCC44359 TaxID=3459125 RepID=UPI00403B140B